MAEVFVAAARQGWAHMYPSDGLAQLQAPEAWMLKEIENPEPRRSVLVAESDGLVAGFAVVRPSQDEDADRRLVGELDTFYSSPSMWGRGVGRALMREALAALRAAGFAEATLWTAEENHRPRAIYEAAGWQLDGNRREKSYLGVSFREVRYRIALSQRR
jgi:GNAT superfamily N-acetyltransferase